MYHRAVKSIDDTLHAPYTLNCTYVWTRGSPVVKDLEDSSAVTRNQKVV